MWMTRDQKRHCTLHSVVSQYWTAKAGYGDTMTGEYWMGWPEAGGGYWVLGTGYPSVCHYDTMTGWAGETL